MCPHGLPGGGPAGVLAVSAGRRRQQINFRPHAPVSEDGQRDGARQVPRAHAERPGPKRSTARSPSPAVTSTRRPFASRLVMAGVDLLTVQTLGGWRTPAMVQRYAHLSPDHMARAIERLVVSSSGVGAAVELRRNFNAAGGGAQPGPMPVAEAATEIENSSRRGGRARLKASDSKSDRGVSPSGVQILSPPPFSSDQRRVVVAGSCGGVAEWPKVRHWKCRVRATVPWVRIPPPPPFFDVAVLDGEVAVPCNPQSAIAGLNSPLRGARVE